MKYIRIFVFALFFAPFAGMAAQNSEFMVAAQLLSAARNADIQQVQALVNNGADINFVDSTGLSIVCTALMNNDVRAAQILQMYGADASKCDRQIKQYNSRTKEKRSGGLFSGLSSAQSLTLTAAGAAVVVGGLLLLTDVFDPDNHNDSHSGGDGNRPGGDGTTPDGTTATAAFLLPYGPAMPNAESEKANFASNQNYYSPSTDGILKDNFTLMSKSKYQNYLLMMKGYSALARGYLGQRTLRNSLTRAPYPLRDAAGNYLYVLNGRNVQGGRPVNVSLITKNGVNAAPNTSLGEWDATEALWDVLLYSEVNGDTVNPASRDNVFSKFYNNKITVGDDISTSVIAEDSAILGNVDLAGMGTVIHNNKASVEDTLLAQIVGGKSAGYTAAQFYGFMPNGQMTIFRTGGGAAMTNVGEGALTGTYTMAGGSFADGDKITLFGKTLELKITSPAGNGLLTFDATEVLADGDTTTPVKYTGYIGTDGLLYIDGGADGKINQAYAVQTGNVLTQVKELKNGDYLNYKAMRQAASWFVSGDMGGGRSMVDIIANTDVVPALHLKGAKTVNDVLSLSAPLRNAAFISFVQDVYERDTTDSYVPGTDAQSFFTGLGSSYMPLVLFSTGAYDTGNTGYIGKAEDATFENAAPLVFDNLEHLFMSVVAVGLEKGTGTADKISGYSPSSKYTLAVWQATNPTTGEKEYNKARVCGIAGRGANGVDPWCFAAAGITDELALASAAGAAGAVKSAFSYLNNKQLFALLALTADGPFLGTANDGTAMTKEALRSYLQGMYTLPNEYNDRWQAEGEDYLDVFKEVYGYGLINVERATTPDTTVYFYDGNNIVSGNGNAYWRAAANTRFRPSSAFNPRGASISATFFDVLESADGELRLPRVWENEFALGTSGHRGLYMGDVLGDLRVRAPADNGVKIGDIDFSMHLSERAYDDNMGGLDDMRLAWNTGRWNFSAGYQRYMTDGASKFTGMPNPVLALAGNAVTSGAQYNMGRWNFSARGFTGAITDEGLLENDPTVSSQFMPARLGLVRGGQVGSGYATDRFAVDFALGHVMETDTVLGASTGGLLALGGGDTTFADVYTRYRVLPNVALSARATFARTVADGSGDFILGMSAIDSDAFSLGLSMGGLSLTVSQPLAARRGAIKYAHAEYDVVEAADGNFDLVVRDMRHAEMALRPDMRETRFTATYRRALGEFTDGALGFIYRVNPNNTDEFGNESIFMLKMSHRLGI